MASTLGVREQPGRQPTETLSHHLQPKEALLVLDNCEHLVVACAGLAEALLRACPNLRILATSREALGIIGETGWPVPSLSLPDPHHQPPVEELLRYGAIRLFIERAAAVVPSFELTQENAAAVTRVCRGLDGMPLAIELAAARVKVLSVGQIASRLDDRFRFLTAGSRTALPRHRTLRATIDWSHELLSDEETVLFRRLSVFAGGFTLEAAEIVCSGEDLEQDQVLDVLSRLVDKSLVAMRERDGGARYGSLETVRQYGWAKLVESGEAEDVRRHHASFFLALAEEAEPSMEPRNKTTDRGRWLERLEVEHDNLRAALRWAGESSPEMGLRLAGALYWFWYHRGFQSEGRRWYERALSEAPAARTTTLVYLNTGPLPDGTALIDTFPPEARQHTERQVEELGDGWRLPMPPWDELAQQANLEGLSDNQLRLLRSKAVAQPFGTYTQGLRPENPARGELPKLGILCSFSVDQVQEMIASDNPMTRGFVGPGWRFVDLPTGHWPMFSRPDDLAELLLGLAVSRDEAANGFQYTADARSY